MPDQPLSPPFTPDTSPSRLTAIDGLERAHDGPPPVLTRAVLAAGGPGPWQRDRAACRRRRLDRECAEMRLACARRRAALPAAAVAADAWLSRLCAGLAAARGAALAAPPS
ncbi:MAG: hypothetical protein RLY86_4477 [Pseudomonadota bacterium]|jgi:hypothetical protein